MKKLIWITISSLLIFACDAGNYGRKNDVILEVSLKKHIEYLASSELEGRKTNEVGYLMAAEYVTNHCRSIGLNEFFTHQEANNNTKSWAQQVPFIDYHFGPENWISFNDNKKFLIEDNYFLLNAGNTDGLVLIDSILFAGYGIHEPDRGWDDFKGIDLEGRYVMIVDGIPDKTEFPEINQLHAESYISLDRKIKFLARQKAAGLIIVSETSRKYWDLTKKIHQKLGYKPLEPAFWADPFHPEVPVIMIHPDIFTSYFPMVGINVSMDLYPSPFFYKSGIKLSVDVKNRIFEAPNIAGIIHGTDSVITSEFVVLSAHLDHIGSEGGKVFPGANDNASSCAALMEIAKEMVKNPPKRSLVFVFYTAEEPCLWGSQYFVSNFPHKKEKILLNINVEMIGKRENQNHGTTAIGPKEFDHYFRKSNPLAVNYLDLVAHKEKYQGSDQYSFYRQNIAAIRFGNLEYPEKHTPKDDVSIIDFKYLKNVTETLLGIVYEFANE